MGNKICYITERIEAIFSLIFNKWNSKMVKIYFVDNV